MFSIPFQVCESVIIDAPIAEVYRRVSQFDEWKHWSPWFCQNSDAKIEVFGKPAAVSHSQKWEGEWVGSGAMHISSLDPHKSIDFHLHFINPWKNIAQSRFDFLETHQGIQVTWSLKSSLPIFLFFLKNRMIALIASGYKRGLMMLKEFAETDSISAKTVMLGVKELPSFYYVGQRSLCTLKELGPSMEKNFAVLHKFVADSFYPEPDFYLSIYHKFDQVKGVCDYTAAMAYYQKKPDEDYLQESGKVPSHRAVQVRQFGEYQYLGNAWAAAMSFLRYKRLKMFRSVTMYEKYVAKPPQVQANDICTEICIPVL